MYSREFAIFHVVGGSLATKRILTIDLMLLKPYFHGSVMRTGAPSCGGSVSPYMPTETNARGCMASSSRSPSTYGNAMPAWLSDHITLGSYALSNATYLAFGVGSTFLSSALNEYPAHGTTMDHASTQRCR